MNKINMPTYTSIRNQTPYEFDQSQKLPLTPPSHLMHDIFRKKTKPLDIIFTFLFLFIIYLIFVNNIFEYVLIQ